MKTLLLSLALLLAAVPVSVSRAQDGPEPTEADRTFFRELKRAALAADRAWVTAHVCFPVRVNIEGRSRMIVNTEEFGAAYTQIMTVDVLTAVRRQAPDTLVRTRQGVMIGEGEIWFEENPAKPAEGEPGICIIAFGNTD